MTGRAAVLVLLAIALVAAGCASSGGTTAGGAPSRLEGVPTPGPAEHPYDGPLLVTDAATHPDAGAAGQIVDCESWGRGGSVSTATYGDGATTDRPEQALYEPGIFDGPRDELLLAKSEETRVLYVLEAGGSVKEAVIVRNGPATEGAGGPGWYVESWAVCDSSELPRSYTDSIGLQIWTDAAGIPVPTTKIEAWRGPEHCDWQSMTFLALGTATYVRDPRPDLTDYFADEFQAHAQLPDDATDTGYQRNGQHLWLSADEQLAYVGTPADVEVWPREQQPLGCD